MLEERNIKVYRDLLVQKNINLADSLSEAGDANKDCQGEGYLVTGFCRSLLLQPDSDFGGEFLVHQKEVNAILEISRVTAREFMDILRPRILQQTSALIQYCNLQQTVLEFLDSDLPNPSVEEMHLLLTVLIDSATTSATEARGIESYLRSTENSITSHVKDMTSASQRLSEATSAPQQEVRELRSRLTSVGQIISNLQKELAYAEVGEQGATLVVAVGRVVRLIGIIRHVIAGVAFLRAQREANRLRDQIAYYENSRRQMMETKYRLNAPLVLVEGFIDSMEYLHRGAMSAITALHSMGNAWLFHSDNLEALRDLVIQQELGPIGLRLALRQASTMLNEVRKTGRTIQTQMSGVQTPQPDLDKYVSDMNQIGTFTSMAQAPLDNEVGRALARQQLMAKLSGLSG